MWRPARNQHILHDISKGKQENLHKVETNDVDKNLKDWAKTNKNF